MSSEDSPLLTVAKSKDSPPEFDLERSSSSGEGTSSDFTSDSRRYKDDYDFGNLDGDDRSQRQGSISGNVFSTPFASRPLRETSAKPAAAPSFSRFGMSGMPTSNLDGVPISQPVVKFRRHSVTPYDTAGGLLANFDTTAYSIPSLEEERQRAAAGHMCSPPIKGPMMLKSPSPPPAAQNPTNRVFRNERGIVSNDRREPEEMRLEGNQGASSSGFRSLRAGRLKTLTGRVGSGLDYDQKCDNNNNNRDYVQPNYERYNENKMADKGSPVLSSPESMASTTTGTLELTTDSSQTCPDVGYIPGPRIAPDFKGKLKDLPSAVPGFPAASGLEGLLPSADTNKAPASGLARHMDNGARYLNWCDLKPLASEPTQSTFQSILQKVGSSDWHTQFAAETDVRRIAVFHPHTLAWPLQNAHAKRTGIYQTFSSSVMNQLVELGESKRSNLAKNTFLVLHDMFLFASKFVAEPQTLEPAVTVCFKKASSPAAGGFVLEETERALRQILLVGDELKILGCISRSLKDGSCRLRARCLAAIGLLLLRLNQSHMNRILAYKDFMSLVRILIKGVSDATAECRYAAKTSLLVVTCLTPDIEARGRGIFSESELTSLRSFIDSSVAQSKPGAISWAVAHYYDIKGLEGTIQTISQELPTMLDAIGMTIAGLDCISNNLQRLANPPDAISIARMASRPGSTASPPANSPISVANNAMNHRSMTPMGLNSAGRTNDRAASAYARHLLQSPASPLSRRAGCMSVQPQVETKSSSDRYVSSLRFRPSINVKDCPMTEQDEDSYKEEPDMGFQNIGSRSMSQPRRSQQMTTDDFQQQRIGPVNPLSSRPIGLRGLQSCEPLTSQPSKHFPSTVDRGSGGQSTSQPMSGQQIQSARAVTPLRSVPGRVLGSQSNGRNSTLREGTLRGGQDRREGDESGQGASEFGSFGFRTRQPSKIPNQ